MGRFLKFGLAFSVIWLAVHFTGCYYDVEEELYPADTSGGSCDTSGVTYSLTIVPVLDGSCNSCHSSSSAQGGVVLDNYNDVKAYVNSGQLMGAIKWDGGYAPMPQGGNKLSDCTIRKFDAWINAGAPNN